MGGIWSKCMAQFCTALINTNPQSSKPP
jgi:hypothetical protein